MNAGSHELTLLALAVMTWHQFVQLAVAHCEAHHLLLHLSRHELVEQVLLIGGRLLSLLTTFHLLCFLLPCSWLLVAAAAKDCTLDKVHLSTLFKLINYLASTNLVNTSIYHENCANLFHNRASFII